MTEEPQYTYIRGQGWQILNFKTLEITDNVGVRWRLEERAPNYGENCSWDWNTYSDLSQFAKILQYNKPPMFTPDLDHTLQGATAKYGTPYFMITVVKL